MQVYSYLHLQMNFFLSVYGITEAQSTLKIDTKQSIPTGELL